jgi:decaprenyl-phosphate phosphoribosyltransferase
MTTDRLSHYIKLLRLKHWHKNFLLFTPLIASGNALNIDGSLKLGLSFVAFCLASSTVYVINDIKDIDVDSKNDLNNSRPLASGAINKNAAMRVIVILAILDIFVFTFLEMNVVFCLLLYIIINILYSFKLKKVPVVELFCVASGFLLRSIAGGFSSNVRLTSWFLLVLSSGAIFLIAGKRISEKIYQDDRPQREVSQFYSVHFLYALLAISGAACINSFAFWSLSFNSNMELIRFSSITFSFCILRYLWCLDLAKGAFGMKPESSIFKDPWLVSIAAVTILLAIGKPTW